MDILKKEYSKTTLEFHPVVSTQERLHILLISCESKKIIERDLFPTDLELFQQMTKKRNDVFFSNINAQEQEVGDITQVDGIIIGGSSASVYEKASWIYKLKGSVLSMRSLNIPVLGCCFGAQIIADALGGKVGKGVSEEIGIKDILLTKYGSRDPIFYDMPNIVNVIMAHQDNIFSIGDEGHKLAHNGISDFQGFSIGEFIKGVQFHPEYNMNALNKIEDIYQINQTPQNVPYQGVQIIDNFLNNVVYKKKYGGK